MRWPILGDGLRVASWPLVYVIWAAGAGKTYFWVETLATLLMGGVIAGLLPVIGLQITGIAFLVCYLVYLPLVYVLARRRIGFVWAGSVVKLLIIIFCALRWGCSG